MTITQYPPAAPSGAQPLDSDLTAIAALSTTSVGRSLLAAADAAAMRTIEGLGTLAVQDANAVAITGGSITGMSTPSASADVATKGYIDNLFAGFSPRSSCRIGTTAALNATYLNGTSGVGATLVNAGALAALSIDGVSAAAGDRVLVKNQASTFQNGIYTVTTVGSGIVAWVLTRTTDYDTTAEVFEGTYTDAVEGTVNAETLWQMTTAGAITMGTTAIVFAELLVASQTVTLTGVITGSGAGSIATSIGSQSGTGTKFLMSAGPVFDAGSASASSWPKLTSGTLLTTPEAGALEYDGANLFFGNAASNRGIVLAEYFARAHSAITLSNTGNMQALFTNLGAGALTLPVGTYLFQAILSFSSMSASSGNGKFDILGAGGATTANRRYRTGAIDGALDTTGTWQHAMISNTGTPNSITSNTTATTLQVEITGTFEVTVTGTIIPSFQLANAVAAVLDAGSFIRVQRIGATTVTSVGPWS